VAFQIEEIVRVLWKVSRQLLIAWEVLFLMTSDAWNPLAQVFVTV
jgi:hypothetical protein